MISLLRTLCALVALLLTSEAAAADLPELSVELHSHLFMEHGLGSLFRGSFDEPLVASSWDERLASKANATTLESSRTGIHVVALFAHPLFVDDMREAVRRQIDAAEAFVGSHPDWAIAPSAARARLLLTRGKRVMVLSLEGAAGVLDSEEDLREFVDDKGIAIVAPLHLTDDRYGGAAVLGGFQYLGNPLGVVDRLLDPHCNGVGVETNRRGMTPLGKRLLVELLARGVWIDLTHAPDAAVHEMLPLLEGAGQPLLLTHAFPRATRAVERGTPDWLLARLAASRGLVGLLPSEDAFREAVASRFCPAGCASEACGGSVHALAAAYEHVARIVGRESIAIGADYNGGMRHLAPACGTGTSIDARGLVHLGQEAELWRALAKIGARVPPPAARLERFLDAWSRVRPRRVLAPDDAAVRLPTRDELDGPSLSLRAGAGVASVGSEAPGIALWTEVFLREGGLALDAEPTLTIGHLEADLIKSLTSEALPLVTVRMSAVGVLAQDWDNRLWARAPAMLVARRTPLDQQIVARIAILRGEARAMPGILKRPGEHHLFLGLGADLLGYKQVVHVSEAATLRGLHVLDGTLHLGGTLRADDGVLIVLSGAASADLNVLVAAGRAGVQSDISMSGRATLSFRPSGVEPFFDATWLATKDDQQRGALLRVLRLGGGVMVTVF